MKKLKIGKLYKLKNNPKEKDWEINVNNYIVLMSIPGFYKRIPEHPIMFLGFEEIGKIPLINYMFLAPDLIKTYHKKFLNDLVEV